MADITGVQQQAWPRSKMPDLIDGVLKSTGDVQVGNGIESDVAVAHLHEGEVSLVLGGSLWHGARREDATAYGPHHGCASPGHAFEKAAAIDAVAAGWDRGCVPERVGDAIAIVLKRHAASSSTGPSRDRS